MSPFPAHRIGATWWDHRPPTWYRNAGVPTFHAASEAWVPTGLMVCGRLLGNPGFAWEPEGNIPPLNACKDCLKRLAKGVK